MRMKDNPDMNITNQIEISFGGHPDVVRTRHQRQTRVERARWWFRRMHEVVEQAVDWNVPPPPRPEQTFLDLRRPDLPEAA